MKLQPRFTIPVLVAAVALTACGPATMQELRASPNLKARFEVPTNYQAAYRTVLDNSRRCWQGAITTAQMVVQGDLYTDIRSGHISVALHGGFGVVTYAGIDLKATGDAQTDVQVYAAQSNWDTSKMVKAWLENGSTSCSV